MAIINKSGITNGNTIQAEHITRAIDALSGVSTDTIVATGSFSGSLKGNANLTTLNVDTMDVVQIHFPNISYTVVEGGGGITLNSDSEDTNTTIKHHGGSVSSSFLETSLTINAPVIASSFTGSLKGNATLNTLYVNLIYFPNTPYTIGDSGNNIILNYDDDEVNTQINHFSGDASTQFLETSLTTTVPVIAPSFTGSLSGTATSASYAVTASYALNAGGGSSFPYTGSALISGSLAVTGSTSILGFVTMTGFLQGNLEAAAEAIVDLHNMGKSGGSGKFVVPVNVATSPTAGALYWNDATGFLYIYQESTTSWRRVALS